jgi:hypothetical protein
MSPDWTAEERQRTSTFLCSMLPVLRDLYGDPFERPPVLLVKDPAAAGAWTFSPVTLEVRSDGAWDPQLLTHELVHAFRGRRVLTRTSDGRGLPELFGFEEGFAEGVADLAMNEYVRRHCAGGDCSAALVPSRRLWTSGLEWTYDFANDASLRTGALWSDGGGTGGAGAYRWPPPSLRLGGGRPAFSRASRGVLREAPGPGRSRAARRCSDLGGARARDDGLPGERVTMHDVLTAGPPLGRRDWIVDLTPWRARARPRAVSSTW